MVLAFLVFRNWNFENTGTHKLFRSSYPEGTRKCGNVIHQVQLIYQRLTMPIWCKRLHVATRKYGLINQQTASGFISIKQNPAITTLWNKIKTCISSTLVIRLYLFVDRFFTKVVYYVSHWKRGQGEGEAKNINIPSTWYRSAAQNFYFLTMYDLGKWNSAFWPMYLVLKVPPGLPPHKHLRFSVADA